MDGRRSGPKPGGHEIVEPIEELRSVFLRWKEEGVLWRATSHIAKTAAKLGVAMMPGANALEPSGLVGPVPERLIVVANGKQQVPHAVRRWGP